MPRRPKAAPKLKHSSGEAEPRRLSNSKTMKLNIFQLLLVLGLAGCEARVSITEVPSSDPTLGPSLITEVSGSNSALEKETRILAGQLSGDEKKDQMIWRKTEAIRNALMDRGYLVQYKFILPNVVFEPKRQKELLKQIKKFNEANTSPAGLSWAGPLDGGTRHATPIRITVIDKKKNIHTWKKFLKGIDSDVKVEQDNGVGQR